MKKPFVIVAAAIAAVIVYGSLYPFQFRYPAGDVGAFATLLRSWRGPFGRGDFIANVFLYMPLGFFALMAMRESVGKCARLAQAVLIALAVCVPVELLQHYVVGRVTSMADVYANALGAALGAFVGLAFGAEFRWPLLREIQAQPIAALLLIAWLGFRLYPYVPMIDAHKYWTALKPVVLTPHVTTLALLHETVLWLVVCALIETIAGRRRSWLLFPAVAAGVLFARILIVGAVLSAPEVLGGALAYALWLSLLGLAPQRRAMIIALSLAALVIALRLDPFDFRPAAGNFGWIPFRHSLRGALGIDARALLQKFFYYGSLIWFLTAAGMRIRPATALVAVMLLATGVAEIYLPSRAASITDVVTALIIGGVFALLARPGTPALRRVAARRA